MYKNNKDEHSTLGHRTHFRHIIAQRINYLYHFGTLVGPFQYSLPRYSQGSNSRNGVEKPRMCAHMSIRSVSRTCLIKNIFNFIHHLILFYCKQDAIK